MPQIPPQICPSCSSGKIYIFHDTVWNMVKGTVYRCHNCEAAFVYPMLTPKQEKKFYQDYNKHVEARGVTTSNTPAEFHKTSRPVAKKRLAIVKDFFSRNEKVLEIGSSTGAFLELLTNMCSGVEPAHDNSLFSQQFAEHIYADISQIPSTEKFDIICMFHVFEHIHDPRLFLLLCKELLSANGRIIIEVPYIEDPLISIYNLKEFKDFYFQPMHPFVYSLKALQYTFKNVGFTEEKIIYHQRYGLDNHLTWLSKRKPGGDRYLSDLFTDNESYKQVMEKVHRTDTIFYIAKNM